MENRIASNVNSRVIFTEHKDETPNSLSRRTTQTISATSCLKALYSASAEERAMVAYFLDFHETGQTPNCNKKSLTDFRDVEQLPQSESQKPSKSNEEDLLNSKPKSGVPTKYHNTCKPASKWGIRGCDIN